MALVNRRLVVDVKKISPRRTISQNNYLHLLLGAYGAHFGFTAEEAKTVYKRDVNPDLYVYAKAGGKFLRSSSELSKEDMAKSIDRFMEHSASMGYPLPLATDPEWMRQIENEIERARHYL